MLLGESVSNMVRYSLELLIQVSFNSILFVLFFVYRYWEATLTSSLFVRKTVLPFDGVETLMLNSDYKIGVVADTAQMNAFKFSRIPLWQKAWLERMEPNLYFYREYIQGLYLEFKHVHTCLLWLEKNMSKSYR